MSVECKNVPFENILFAVFVAPLPPPPPPLPALSSTYFLVANSLSDDGVNTEPLPDFFGNELNVFTPEILSLLVV